jgi:hypothetical protein
MWKPMYYYSEMRAGDFMVQAFDMYLLILLGSMYLAMDFAKSTASMVLLASLGIM